VIYSCDGKAEFSESLPQSSSHIYLYSAFYNTDCIKAASQW